MTKKKTHKIEEKPATYNVGGNRAPSDSIVMTRPIPGKESGAFVMRLKEVLRNEESVSAFARRCIPGESVIRSYLNDGKQPRMDYLVSIADAAGVTVDWLATGRLPKFRTELREPPPDPLNPDKLRLALILTDDFAKDHPLSAEQRADRVLSIYNRLIKGDAS